MYHAVAGAIFFEDDRGALEMVLRCSQLCTIEHGHCGVCADSTSQYISDVLIVCGIVTHLACDLSHAQFRGRCVSYRTECYAP